MIKSTPRTDWDRIRKFNKRCPNCNGIITLPEPYPEDLNPCICEK